MRWKKRIGCRNSTRLVALHPGRPGGAYRRFPGLRIHRSMCILAKRITHPKTKGTDHMKGTRSKFVLVVLALSLAIAGLAFAAEAEKLNLKVGDSYFVCNCPPGCCEDISSKEGQCGCKKDLVKAKVTRVEDGKAWFKADGWQKEKAFKTAGLYVCGCGSDCKCNMISDKPGKCGCGKEMKKLGG